MGDHESIDLRISDAEREAVIGILREQTTVGRLTLEEFEERLGEVYAARTDAELRLVLRELPVQPPRTAADRGPGGLVDRTEHELRQRWRRRIRGELVGFVMPNFVCNLIWFMGDMQYWWPGWVLLASGAGLAGTLARGFDPDAERAKVAAEQRAAAMAEIEIDKLRRPSA